MRDETLAGRKLDAYVITKILKYCTGSSARSYQCKFAMDQAAFMNKNIESIEEVGPALKKIIHSRNLRGKFSSVHPDLAAEGITKVEVGEEGLFFIKGGVIGSFCSKICLRNYLILSLRWRDSGVFIKSSCS